VLTKPHRLGFAAKRQLFVYLGYALGAIAGGILTWSGIEAMAVIPPAATLGALGLHLAARRS